MLTRKSKSSNDTLYRVGSDRVLIDDVTRFGLHRKHIVRTGAMPDVATWMMAFPQAHVQAYMGDDGTGHLWLYWKPKGSQDEDPN